MSNMDHCRTLLGRGRPGLLSYVVIARNARNSCEVTNCQKKRYEEESPAGLTWERQTQQHSIELVYDHVLYDHANPAFHASRGGFARRSLACETSYVLKTKLVAE